MEINSAGASNHAQQVKIATQAAEARKSQEASQQARRAQAQEENRAPPPQPVKNTEGQTTGKVVNVTA